ncbi:MAG: SRPBCC family protein [Planctomycetota bacterium]
MSVLTVETHVAAPQERVFDVYTQVDRLAERIPTITAVEVLTDGPFGDGTRWRETRVVMKKEATEEMWVTGFEPPHRYNVEAESNGMKYSTLMSFTPERDGTTVRWEFTSTPQSFGARLLSGVFSVLLKGTMRKHMLGDLEALRAVAENGEASS